jgi:CheY-like chemotaxis protein
LPRQPIVLIAEDDQDLRAVAAAFFEDMGCSVLQATDGVVALEMLNRHRTIDLLFADLVMPRLDGAKLATAALRARPHLMIVATTGLHDTGITRSLPPRIPVLFKPYQHSELLADELSHFAI